MQSIYSAANGNCVQSNNNMPWRIIRTKSAYEECIQDALRAFGAKPDNGRKGKDPSMRVIAIEFAVEIPTMVARAFGTMQSCVIADQGQ